MNNDELRHFRSEIQRQISLGNTYDEHIPGIVTVPDLGERYTFLLRRLDRQLSDGLNPLYSMDPSYSLAPTTQDIYLLWYIPSFCEPYSYHLDPEYIKQRSLSRFNLQSTFSNTYTDDIWRNPLLFSWLEREASSLLLLQGDFDSANRMGIFGVKLAQHIETRQPVAYIPINMVEQNGEARSPDVAAIAMLRHVVLQALRRSKLPESAHSLIEITKAVSVADTSGDWLDILERLAPNISRLNIILHFGTSQIGADTLAWPQRFKTIFENIQRASPLTVIRVLITTCQPSMAWGIPTISVRRPTLLNHSATTFPIRRNPIPENIISLPISDIIEGTSNTEVPGGGETVQAQVDSNSTAASGRLEWKPADKNSNHASKPGCRQDFHIAIFCALVLESDAIISFMDQQWDRKEYGKVVLDPNSYTLGALGVHNVVLIHLPSMGKVVAASAASSCRISFPGIRLALVVGICGGVPFGPANIERILGDVVISDGLVQYDFGRQFPNDFKRKRTLHDNHGRPDSEIRGFLARLAGRGAHRKVLTAARGYVLSLQATEEPFSAALYQYPGVEEDVLHQPSSLHKHLQAATCPEWEKTCGIVGACDLARTLDCQQLNCDFSQLVPRQRLNVSSGDISQGPSESLELHIGTVASGDKVMKSGEERDKVAKEEGVIAFEMEGAGIWDQFPCLIIKGICDYADCHKSKKWQYYAAATAAAQMKAVLDEWD